MTLSSSPVVSVRRAEVADLPVLRANEPHPELNLAEHNLSLQEQGQAIFCVAESAGSIAGTGLLDLRRDHELVPEIKGLWVYPQFRRMGVGSAMSHFLEDQARELGIVEVFWAVDPNNYKAVPMCLELGYSPTGNHLQAENPDSTQVDSPDEISEFYAIYRKSLLNAF